MSSGRLFLSGARQQSSTPLSREEKISARHRFNLCFWWPGQPSDQRHWMYEAEADETQMEGGLQIDEI